MVIQELFAKLTVEFLAYLAGFIDRDGAIMAQIVPRDDYVLKYQIRVTIQISQRESRKPFLEKLMEEIGQGSIACRNGMCDLAIVKSRAVYQLLSLLHPYLRIKKQQALLIMEMLEGGPMSDKTPEQFVELCKKANEVSALNGPNKPLVHTWQSVQAKLLPPDAEG
uniref:Putative LAGLIDADG homing endonuclease n=1 Tax=Stephanosphaera pluvialis TaxID=51712 RepID=A0A0S2IDX4_9CHLO|nr:putative LAGLIDADG homing endonuclease [Stephanosphaera pluvialis]